MPLACLLLLAITQTPSTQSAPLASAAAAQAPSALVQALVGQWAGVLEYRDYSEPVSSPKRVLLPTWLQVTPAMGGVTLDYTYDDGPAKVVRSHASLVLDLAAHTYRVTAADGTAESYTVEGLDGLHAGLGTLLLTGQGTDNKLPAEIRTTWTVRQNLLSWLEEVRPLGSTQPFVFRHRYTLTRGAPPAPPLAATTK